MSVTSSSFKRATKKQARLRLAIVGPAGSGKTFTALTIAAALSDDVAAIDTERGSMSLYSNEFVFDVKELDSFEPSKYRAGIKEAEADGFGAIIIDSLTHAWAGTGGLLEMKDNAASRQKTKNDYTAWRDVTPEHNALVDSMLQSKIHVIATMRSKTEYVMETQNGKTVPRKVGMAPVQRDGMDFEFGLVFEMDIDNVMVVSKSRCRTEPLLAMGSVVKEPGAEVAAAIKRWVSEGESEMTRDQENRIDVLLSERIVPPAHETSMLARVAAGMTEAKADDAIAWLSALPVKDGVA